MKLATKCVIASLFWFVGQQILLQTPAGASFQGPTYDFANTIFAVIGIMGIGFFLKEFLHSFIK